MTIQILLLVSGCIFGFIALMHLLRLIYKVEIVVGGKKIPLWISIIGFIIPLLLAIEIFTVIFTNIHVL